jgi:outer membrane protein OmpA-like peptidoglycan-associated protein
VDGFFNAISLTPWSVEIPHEEVLFATGSATIEQSEVPKLEESLDRIQSALEKYHQIKGVQLFIAGHTDTQGGAASNMTLSRSRARAIGAWFVGQGLPLVVQYEGFGESSLRVKTKDEVDEPANRRVDYILGVEPPALSSGAWKRLN